MFYFKLPSSITAYCVACLFLLRAFIAKYFRYIFLSPVFISSSSIKYDFINDSIKCVWSNDRHVLVWITKCAVSATYTKRESIRLLPLQNRQRELASTFNSANTYLRRAFFHFVLPWLIEIWPTFFLHPYLDVFPLSGMRPEVGYSKTNNITFLYTFPYWCLIESTG